MRSASLWALPARSRSSRSSSCCGAGGRSSSTSQCLPAGPAYVPELAASLDPGDVLDRALDRVGRAPGRRRSADRDRRGRRRPATRATGLTEDEVERTLVQMPNHPDLSDDRGRVPLPPRRRRRRASKLPRAAPRRRAARPTARRSAPWRRSPRTSSAGVPPSDRGGRSRASPAGPGPAIWNAMRYHRGARARRARLAHRASTTAALFYEFLSREIARAQRYERYVSVIVFDRIDFKRINDRIGHSRGDAVLNRRSPTESAASSARRISPAASAATSSPSSCRSRAGTMPSSSPTGSRSQSAAQKDREDRDAEDLGRRRGAQNDKTADLFKRADHALYRAKNAGKARVVAS